VSTLGIAKAEKFKKLCSLQVNQTEILSVEVELVPGLPTPQLDSHWLRRLMARQRALFSMVQARARLLKN